jgi:hypothetical protein
MRRTVTLEKDVERMLREAMHKSRTSFKKVLNAAVRAGFAANRNREAVPFVVRAKPMGLRAGIDPTGLNRLADELELKAVSARSRSTRR